MDLLRVTVLGNAEEMLLKTYGLIYSGTIITIDKLLLVTTLRPNIGVHID